MTNKEADRIIKNYIPYKGFYDLSEKPKSLTKIKYAKILRTQNFLAWQNKKIDYLKKFEPIQYKKIKELSANYQWIVREHWEVDKL